MYKVLIQCEDQEIDFIIYNILFEKSKYTFTIDKLFKTVQNYNNKISMQAIKFKIDCLVDMGMIRQKLGEYCTVD